MARTVKPLTNTEVEKAKAKDKEYSLSDGNGLYLFIRTNGVKVWRFQYCKPFTKKRTNISLGIYPELSLADAIRIREEYSKCPKQISIISEFNSWLFNTTYF